MKADNDNLPGGGNQPLCFLSVCSGIEAASCAWPHWQAVAFSEIEKFPSAVLAHNFPDVPNLGDFTKIDTTKLGRVDILCGGTPCQAFSVAGLRKSLADDRGNLSLEFVRLAHELAGHGKTNGNGLRNVVWENVVGVLSTKDNAFGCFLAGLVGADGPITPPGRWTNAGMVSGPKGRAAWRVLDAQYFGVAQRRRRVIVVADFGSGADPAAVLFEPEGVFRHSPPSRETGQGVAADVAPSLVSSGRGVERTGDTRGQDPVVAVTVMAHGQGGAEISEGRSPTLTCNHEAPIAAYTIQERAVSENPNNGPQGKGWQEGVAFTLEARNKVQAVCATGDITHTLKAEGADASEDGTGRGTPIVYVADPNQVTSKTNRSQPKPEVSHTLPAVANSPICFTAKDYGADAQEDIAPTLRSGGHDKSHANAGVMPAVLYAPETYPTLSASEGGTLTQVPPFVTSAVRRLTPVECERLQGFPDNYTQIPWRGKPADDCPDGPRYKALGNSWAVPKFRWLGERIERLMPPVAVHTAANDNHSSLPIKARASHA